MADIFKPKRGSHNVIANINPLLQEGEVVFEYPEPNNRALGLIKMGDGVHRYNDLRPFVVTITDYIPIAEKGAPNGIAPLNSAGLIDADYLPSYVDDVVEYPSRAEFPVPGEKGKIYVDISATWNNIYRWSGSIYVCIGTSVRYELKQNRNVIRLEGTDDSVNTVDVTQIYCYEGLRNFPNPGKEGAIYIDTLATYNNLYRWDDTDRRYYGCANSNSYSLEKAGPQIILHASDGTDSAITSEILEYNGVDQFPLLGIDNVLYIDISTTENNTYRWDNTANEYKHITTSVKYIIAKNENNLILTGSDGSVIDVANDVLFFETKDQFPAEDPEDPETTISRFKFFVDYSTNSIYRWDGFNYILISGNTTYTLSRGNNKISLKTTVAGVDSTTEIPTSVASYDTSANFPTTGQVGIIYIDENKGRFNSLYKWDSTLNKYDNVGANNTYELQKKENELQVIEKYENNATIKQRLTRDVMVYNSTNNFPTTGSVNVIYIDTSKASNNAYVWNTIDNKYHREIGDTLYSISKDDTSKTIKLVATDPEGNDSTTSIPLSTQVYNTTTNFPTTGQLNVLYVSETVDSNELHNNVYRWTGTNYVLVAGDTNYYLALGTNEWYLNYDKPGGGGGHKSTMKQSISIYNSTSSFPTTGAENIIYVDTSKSNNNLYRWDYNDKKYVNVAQDTKYTISKSGTTDTITLVGTNKDGNYTSTVTEIRYNISKSGGTIKLTGKVGDSTANTSEVTVTEKDTTYSLSKSGSTITLTGSDGSTTSVTDANVTYTLSKSGSTVTLTGSDGSTSQVSNLGGVEIRTTDPTGSELYAGKMWIKV